MLETKKIDDLFCLLRTMTRPWTDHPNAAPLIIIWCLLKIFLSGIVITVIAYFWLPALWQRFEVTASDLHDARFVVGCLFIVFSVLLILAIIVGVVHIARHRKELVPHLYPKNELHRDAEFITQLLAFDKATLTYGLLQYPPRWLFTQELVAVLAGDLRKLGLFPALTALLISAAILLKADSNPFLLFLRDLVVIAVIYYMVAFFNFLSNKRPRQVIQLLEYAIQHADQYTTPSDANR